MNRSLCGLVICAIALPIAHGAGIGWGSPQNISSPTDVLVGGTVVAAYNFSGTAVTVNGVLFNAFSTSSNHFPSVTTGNVTLTTSGNNVINFTLFLSALPAPYASLLSAGDYAYTLASDTANTLTVTISGLTAGSFYEVEIWVNDSRPGTTNRTETVDSGPTLRFETSPAGSGQYIIGTFTATGPTQSFTLAGFDPDGTADRSASQINAIEVLQVSTAVPALSGWALALLGVLLGGAAIWSLLPRHRENAS